ncbi:relaxase/mobilization nuclease domain-containing protein [Ponticaulis profundi]|uniref:Relaxase/mobilization nuclease domain-containing protein n=1 Tax=Ponticaulis profundi TaxID=2665222 RepID=A0ABW1SCF1_9PROT
MILVGNQRGGARDLANHLTKDENDHVIVHEIKGFVSDDLHSAFKEAEAMSKGTKCRQYLFSLSFNPPGEENVSTEDFERAIDKAEKSLGLTDQPRAIVFHEKEGRRHAHVVWNRIDTDEMKAIQLSHSKRKLNAVSKELYLEHGWRIPAGYINNALRDPLNFTLEEWQQAKRNGQDPRIIKQAFQDAWATSDTAAGFKHALAERGYVLAKGDRRGVVAVDRFGEVYSVPRQLGLKTKQVRERFTSIQDLPSLENSKMEASKLVQNKLTSFVLELEAKARAVKERYQEEKKSLVTKQRAERRALLEQHAIRQADETLMRQSRFRHGLKGVWDVLTGEHFRIARQNKLEFERALQRDRDELDFQIERHKQDRRSFLKDIKRDNDLQKAKTDRQNLLDEIAEISKQREHGRKKDRGRSLSL